MRLFLAVPVSSGVLHALRPLLPRYDTEFTRLVPEANLHLTLHFIGEAPTDYLPDLEEKLARIATQQVPFTLQLKELAPGPKTRNPRLVWARFHQHPAFEALATAICQALGVKPDHSEFIPHITVARYRKGTRQPADLPVLTPVNFPEYPVQSIAIWESKLQSPHPHYRIRREFPLTGMAAA